MPLRPLGAAEILDAPFAAMRRYPRPMLGVSLVLATILEAGSLGWTKWAHARVADRFGVDTAATVGLGLNLLALVIGLAVTGWLTALTAEAVLGRDVTSRQVWERVRPRLGVLVLAAIVGILPVGLLVAAGALAGATGGASAVVAVILAGPVIWLSVIAAFLAPVVILENASVRVAVRRAFVLVKGSWWRCFGILLLAGLVGSMVAVGLLLPFEVGALRFVSGGFVDLSGTTFAVVVAAIGSTVAYTVTAPLFAGVVAVLSIDLRIRAEAFDLTALGSVPPPAPRPGTGPAPAAARTVYGR